MCTLFTEKGTFQLNSAGGSQTITLNGSFQPKAVILWTSWAGATLNTFQDNAAISFGFTDGTNEGSVNYQMRESNETEDYLISTQASLQQFSSAGATQDRVDISSFGSTGFTISGINTDSVQHHIHYIAIGGTDITNVSIVSTTVGSTTTGNKSYTGTGTSFQPDFALMLTGADGSGINSLSSGADQSLVSIGAAKSTSEQFVAWIRDETVGTADCDSYVNNAACLSSCDIASGAVTFLANFVSFDNAAGGGITVNVTNASEASTKPLLFLLIKGGVWDCGTFASAGTTGNQNVTIDTGLDPALVFLCETRATANNTVALNAHMGIGASDGTNQGCSFVGNDNGIGTFETARKDVTDACIGIIEPAATATSSLTPELASMSSMSTAGQFTLNWSASAVSRLVAFWVVGASGAAPQPIAQTIYLEWEEV